MVKLVANIDKFAGVDICLLCIPLLCRVANASAENKMNVANLATTFGPVLFKSENVSC